MTLDLPALSAELVVLIAALGLLLASYFHEKTAADQRGFGRLFALLALAGVACFFNFGTFRGEGQFVHEHEQYHLFLGSKYLEELRYDAIYDAGVLAAVESGIFEDTAVLRRNPMTFAWTLLPITPEREAEVRARFTPERWSEFQQDVRWFGDSRGQITDHGNTGSPVWAMVAGLFTRHLPLNEITARIFGGLDLVLLLLLFFTVWRTFGGRTLSLTMIVGLCIPLVNAYLGGSILRMDWIVTLGLSICMFEKRHYRIAGLLLGYAVAVKLLAGIMVLPFGLRFLVRTVQRRSVDRDQLRYMVYALIGLASFVLLSALYFGGLQLWQDYAQRLLVTFHQHYYSSQHSFRDLFLQAYHGPGSAWSAVPDRVAASLPYNSIAPLRGLFVTAQAILLTGLVIVAARNPVRYAFALGPMALFVLLVSNRYYWQAWTVSAIALAPTYRKDWRHLGFICLVVVWLASGQIVSRTSLNVGWGGYFGSYGLFWLGAGLLAMELISWWRERRAATSASA